MPSSSEAPITPLKCIGGGADALQLLPQPIYVNQSLSRVLLHMDMLVQVAIVDKSVELRSGLVSEASCSLTT